ncbi:hypothetical protein [Erythrobacter sp.]|uniref:hypothetical protein n=1 Tax=Erythrobacter sp. TaxID=1042 RepID=UPI002615C0D4|nr:hypothetical protein [Erythrobacter sp.]
MRDTADGGSGPDGKGPDGKGPDGKGPGGQGPGGDGPTGGHSATLAAKWEDLHQHAAQVAKLAQLSPEPFTGPLAAFPAQIGDATEWQRELAWQGVDDIEAMMRPGLAALETLRQRGASANAPALALWREFYTARGAVLALADR